MMDHYYTICSNVVRMLSCFVAIWGGMVVIISTF